MIDIDEIAMIAALARQLRRGKGVWQVIR
jgi:hypothetical protein